MAFDKMAAVLLAALALNAGCAGSKFASNLNQTSSAPVPLTMDQTPAPASRAAAENSGLPPAAPAPADVPPDAEDNAPASQTAPPVRPGRGPTQPPTGLAAAMNQMLDLLADLKKESADPASMNQTLRDLAEFERDVAICKLYTPPSVNRLSGDEKASAIDDYRIMMSDMMRAALDMEDAVSDRKPDQIKKLLKRIDDTEEQGHVEFIPP